MDQQSLLYEIFLKAHNYITKNCILVLSFCILCCFSAIGISIEMYFQNKAKS